MTHARVPWDLHFFAFTTFTQERWKEGFFNKKKRGKATFTEHPCLQTAANSQKRGKNTRKSPTFLGKCRRKKDKRRSFPLENSDVYLAPFGEGCESKKYKIAVMRAREGRTDEKRKLYTVIATNNEPFARQLHYAKQSTDLSTSGKSRTTHSRMLHESSSAFSRSPTQEQQYRYFDKFTYQNRVQYYFSCHFLGDFSLFA